MTFEAVDSDGQPITKKAHNVREYDRIVSGILWINGPFVEKFWPDRKPVKPKHACPECGAKHAIRKVA